MEVHRAMPTADVDVTAEFVEELARSRLLSREDLEKVESHQRVSPQPNASALADFLVQRGLLTRFQADYVLEGRGEDLVLSQFVLTEVLGKGSMGSVYKARSTDGSWFALKIVPRRNVVSLQEVADKARALWEIRHPRVSALVQVGACGDRVYLAWSFLEGGEKLDAFVRRLGRLTPRQAAQIGVQVASGLLPYHQQGLFHGLLKPTDILIGTDRRLRILDFGVGFLLTSERGKSLLDTMTNTRALARGLDCSSPESIMDPLARTPAGDQYSLGCILYFCLTGQFPFPDDNPVKKMLGHQAEEPRPLRDLNPDVPPRLTAIVRRLMAKDPAGRYGSMDEVLRAFQALTPSSPRPVVTPPPAAPPAPKKEEPPVPAGQRMTLLVLTGFAAALLLGGTLGWLLAHH
jgi:serine/threonine-protein kinase